MLRAELRVPRRLTGSRSRTEGLHARRAPVLLPRSRERRSIQLGLVRQAIGFGERRREIDIDVHLKRDVDIGLLLLAHLILLLAALRTQHITLVRALLDLTRHAPPMCGQRHMPLHQLLHAKALRRVVRLLPAHTREQIFELLARERRFDALDTHEPLFVEHLQAA